MPTTRSVAALAGRPYGLFEALLRGDTSAALSLLEAGAAAPGADPPALLFPVGGSGLTAVHAAVLGGCAAAIPAIAAVGAPLDAALQLPAGGIWSEAATPLRQLLRACGHGSDIVDNGATALSLAVRKEDVVCVRQLLEQGANPAAGGGLSLLYALWHLELVNVAACQQNLQPLLQHGLDPLAPMWQGLPDSLLVRCKPSTAALALAHLEQQRAAGGLQLGSVQRAAQLMAGIAQSGEGRRHLPLARHGIAALEQLLGLAGGGGIANGVGGLLAGADAAALCDLLNRVVQSGQPPVLEVLLASRLPFDLAVHVPFPWNCPPLSVAAQRPNAAVCVRLLHQAGAPLSAANLYQAIDDLSLDGESALLACGTPAVDVSKTEASSCSHELTYSWTCPIQRAVHMAFKRGDAASRTAAQMLEALWAAGYRPTVYRQARLPGFLQPSSTAPVFAELDPLALYDATHPQHAQLRGLVRGMARPYGTQADTPTEQRLLFLARTGGAWSPATHHHWPPAFKQAARTLLLCAAAGSSSGSAGEGAQRVTRAAARRRPQRTPNKAARLLAALPQDTLLHVVKLAAEPMSAWL